MKAKDEAPTKADDGSSSIWDKLADKYDASQRARIDRAKEDGLDLFHQERMKEGELTPTRAQKVGRVLLEMMGLKLEKVELSRDKAARYVAREEMREESRRTATEAAERSRIENERREAEAREEQAERERKSLENAMADARDYFNSHRKERLQNQRAQELLERKLNEQLLTIDKLEEEVLSENPDVEKSSVSYGDSEIPVYTLHGLSVKMLTHTVDYRRLNKPGEIGTETYKKVMEDPSVWDTRRDIAEQEEGFGTREGNARGDTISTSYTNSERNFDSRMSGELTYGFSHVDGDSVVYIANGDGGTSNMAGTSEAKITDPDEIDTLEGAQSTSIYNEILLRRYSENGMPKRPDYIVVENGIITETVLKHAKYFNIPIVNLDTVEYNERLKKRGEEIMESFSEEDSYQDIDGKYSELLSNSYYKTYVRNLSATGRAIDIPATPASSYEERCTEVSKFEFEKRIEFIVETLQKYIEEIRAATSRGERAPKCPDGLRIFEAHIIDAHNGKWQTENGEIDYDSIKAPSNCSSIVINMSLKGSSRITETCVYDGEHPYDVETALKHGYLTQEKLDQADSSYYNRLLPLVEEYFVAMRENRKNT